MVLGEGGVDPVVSGQDVLIEPRIHPFPGPASRERSSASHEGVEDGKGVKVGVEIGGALAGEDHVSEVWQWVGTHDGRSFSLHL